MSKNYIGLSFGYHDAAAAVVSDGNILYAGHSERYSKMKNDPGLHPDLIKAVNDHLTSDEVEIAYYEKSWLKNVRQLITGEWLYNDKEPVKETIKKHFNTTKYKAYKHHLSHAAAGFATSPYQSAAVLVIDAIGEFETVSIWRAWVDSNHRCRYKKVATVSYPNSVGLTYSAFTQRVGLKANEEEYILMGMAAYGKPIYADQIRQEIIRPDIWLNDFPPGDERGVRNIKNCHKGIAQWPNNDASHFDIASSIQEVTEDIVYQLAKEALMLTGEKNLVYMGGVALNCVANAKLGQLTSDIWIMPNPGDAGSALGAAALAYGKKLKWKGPYLGSDLGGEYPVQKLFNALLSRQIIGVANGRAEFGPRALGNRSLLADPRGADIKDRVNAIKHRQNFRPFAPVILADVVHNYFDMPSGWTSSPYMQSIARCKFPNDYPAICHHDGTSRVQTVTETDHPGLYKLLKMWYQQTGCPMLLNTSLNVKGKPMVNSIYDAKVFERRYKVPVLL